MSGDLYKQLLEAYTVENLNRITAQIIDSYRNKQYDKIENLVRHISSVCTFTESKINKYFSRLVLLYHPDKINYYRNQLNEYKNSAQDSVLEKISHILITLDVIDKQPDFSTIDSNIMEGFEMEFGFDDEDMEDIHSWNVYDLEGNMEIDENMNFSNDFFTLLKIKEFGYADTHIPEYELQNLDGMVELSGVQMDDLNGIEFCTNLKSLDLSDNHIMDVTKLGYLTELMEVDLSHNSIEDISVLDGLINLQSLDLAFNSVNDLTALFDLDRLKYVNLIGNPVSEKQIEILKSNGRIVIC